ncbi:MAG: hypothetical protein K0S75_1959, partial [Clostridia bacterium]|nr:hypothetical protein [Clostridia bacterium]
MIIFICRIKKTSSIRQSLYTILTSTSNLIKNPFCFLKYICCTHRKIIIEFQSISHRTNIIYIEFLSSFSNTPAAFSAGLIVRDRAIEAITAITAFADETMNFVPATAA